jgi:hypothetical protein
MAFSTNHLLLLNLGYSPVVGWLILAALHQLAANLNNSQHYPGYAYVLSQINPFNLKEKKSEDL